jgi:hypothetical protein
MLSILFSIVVIAFDDFYAKTMTLFKLCKAGLIYLSLAVYQEERKRPHKGVTIPMCLPQINLRDKK